MKVTKAEKQWTLDGFGKCREEELPYLSLRNTGKTTFIKVRFDSDGIFGTYLSKKEIVILL